MKLHLRYDVYINDLDEWKKLLFHDYENDIIESHITNINDMTFILINFKDSTFKNKEKGLIIYKNGLLYIPNIIGLNDIQYIFFHGVYIDQNTNVKDYEFLIVDDELLVDFSL